PFIPRFRDNRPDESIAAARPGLDPTVAAGTPPPPPPQRPALNGEVALLDRLAGPRGFDQRVLQYECTGLFDQHAQHRDRPTADRYRLTRPAARRTPPL